MTFDRRSRFWLNGVEIEGVEGIELHGGDQVDEEHLWMSGAALTGAGGWTLEFTHDVSSPEIAIALREMCGLPVSRRLRLRAWWHRRRRTTRRPTRWISTTNAGESFSSSENDN